MKRQLILTIDVEDWYFSSQVLFKDIPKAHSVTPEPSVVANTLKSLELLRRTQNKATFFILTSVAELFPDLVKEILKEGHEIASHGHRHCLVYRMSREEFREDVEKSLEILNRLGVSKVYGYRAPYWSITQESQWALEIIASLGFVYDSSIFPIRRKVCGIPTANRTAHRILPNLWEFPPATLRLFNQNIPIAGGGYWRILPYQLVSWGVQRSKEETGVFYFHPYELDPRDTRLKHPVRSASTLFTWFVQVIGRSSLPKKINRLLEEHRFTSIADALTIREPLGVTH